MMHGFTDQEWMEYFDGKLAAEARDRLEAHLIGCELCWEFYDRIARTNERLRAAAERMRESVPLSDRQMHLALQRMLERLRLESPQVSRETSHAAPLSIGARLADLAAVMTPMCGWRTASSALKAAARSSPARSLEGVTIDNWTPFLTSLTSIAVVMCGETGANLVWETGRSEC